MSKNLMAIEYLKDTDGTAWNSKAMTTATGTYYSDKLSTHFSMLDCSMLIKTSAGALDITYEVSDDGKIFYEPYNTAGQKINVIAEGLTADRWISFTPIASEYMRFKFILTVSDSTVTAKYRQRERA